METEVNPNFKIPENKFPAFKALNHIMSALKTETERMLFMYPGYEEYSDEDRDKLFARFDEGEAKLADQLLTDIFNSENGMKGIMKDQI
jgi:hypothetical protein